MRQTLLLVGLAMYLMLMGIVTSGSLLQISGHTIHGWTTYRYDIFRSGDQPFASKLSDPKAVKTLAVKWTFSAHDSGYFGASPIVVNRTVFIGSSAGYFYALDEDSGALKWRYPNPPDAP